MYINNIESILKANMPLKLKFSEGSIVSGKIISLQSNEGIIKLYDGTIIPAIFISENIMEKEKYVRFKVEGFNDDKILLKTLAFDENEIKQDSLEGILKNLNVPVEKGRDIIMSLIKFNLPANDENILSIYKNISFLNTLKDMSDKDILAFLEKYTGKEFTKESSEFLAAKDLITKLSNIDIDFLTFLTENEIPKNVSSMVKTQNIMNDGFLINRMLNELNSILTQADNNKNDVSRLRQVLDILKNNPEKLLLITEQLKQDSLETNDMSFTNMIKEMSDNDILNFLKNYIGEDVTDESSDFFTFKDLITQLSKLDNKLSTGLMQNNAQNDETLISNNHKFNEGNTLLDKILKIIKPVLDLKDEKKEIYTLKQALNILKTSPEKLQLPNQQFLKEVFDNLDILKNIYNNYNIYAFNALQNGNLYKNNIIIKHRYKNSKHIDVNDVKVFITIETPHLGVVENYLYKKNNDIMITIKVEDKFVSLFKNNISLLKNRLKIKGFNSLNISVEKLKNKNDMVGLSSFFNEYMLKELDVMV